MENSKLCFIKYIGSDIDGLNVYEFLFSSTIDDVWGDNFEYFPMGLCRDLAPYENAYDEVKVVKTRIKLILIQDSMCNSYQDCIDGCVALGYEDLSTYEEYPEEGRVVLPYGIDYGEVEELLAKKNILMNEKEGD